MGAVRPPRPDLADLNPYDAQEPHVDINLSANENPANLPHELVASMAKRMPEFKFNRYPDPMASKLRAQIAEANGLEPGNVLVGNGGDELIFDLMLAWGGPGRKLLNLPPTFAMYEIDARLTGTTVVEVPRRTKDFSIDEEAALERLSEGDIDIVMVSHPNNPTGNVAPETFLIDVLKSTDALVLVDEAYFEFSRHTMRPHMERHPNLVILRTFSKAFSLAGLRVGYILGNEDVILELTKVRQPYSVDRFSQWTAGLVFRERVVFESQIQELLRQRDVIEHGLGRIPHVKVFGSEANFVLFRVERAAAVWRDLLHSYSILVRDVSRVPGCEECLRVSVGTEADNRAFLAAMEELMTARRESDMFGTTNGDERDPAVGATGPID
ncbi:MAG TPA: histidinol-phosphate transaminase [Coriobacteriia bacterium]